MVNQLLVWLVVDVAQWSIDRLQRTIHSSGWRSELRSVTGSRQVIGAKVQTRRPLKSKSSEGKYPSANEKAVASIRNGSVRRAHRRRTAVALPETFLSGVSSPPPLWLIAVHYTSHQLPGLVHKSNWLRGNVLIAWPNATSLAFKRTDIQQGKFDWALHKPASPLRILLFQGIPRHFVINTQVRHVLDLHTWLSAL